MKRVKPTKQAETAEWSKQSPSENGYYWIKGLRKNKIEPILIFDSLLGPRNVALIQCDAMSLAEFTSLYSVEWMKAIPPEA